MAPPKKQAPLQGRAVIPEVHPVPASRVMGLQSDFNLKSLGAL